MVLEKEKVEGIARLARLELKTTEIEAYSRDLSRILELIGEMQGVNTAEVASMEHPLEIRARLREDQVTETDQRGKYQALAPATADGFYLVPKVIE